MNSTGNPWNRCLLNAASSFWPILARTSEYTTSAPFTASLGSFVISILLIPAPLAFLTVFSSGSNPFGQAHTKWRCTTAAIVAMRAQYYSHLQHTQPKNSYYKIRKFAWAWLATIWNELIGPMWLTFVPFKWPTCSVIERASAIIWHGWL